MLTRTLIQHCKRLTLAVLLGGTLLLSGRWNLAQAQNQTLPSQRYQLPALTAKQSLQFAAVDVAKAKAEDGTNKSGALRYAIGRKISVNPHALAKVARGEWRNLSDGQSIWRMRVLATDAVSLDFGFNDFFLPQGAQLYIADLNGKVIRGPYTDADNPRSGEFWTPVVPGGDAVIELLVPSTRKSLARFELMSANQAYRDIFSLDLGLDKSGTCNVDTVCPQGDNFRDQIRAVARYTVGGGLCSGQLINNTAQDGKAYFITANHCLSSQSAANSVVTYWNYESPTCRAVGTANNGTVISTSVAVTQTGGATLRSTLAAPDTTLLELNTAVPAAANPFWDGWDRTDTAKSSATVIHHPQGDEKRISFENDTLLLNNAAVSGVPGTNHWRVNDWDTGTTEPGSSGSGLLSPEKRLIGVLSGGGAACGNNAEDYFGRLSVAWTGGGTNATRVSNWLDPTNSGANTLDGKGSCAAPNVVLNVPATANAGVQVPISVLVNGGILQPGLIVEFDLDGDGVFDRSGSQTSISTVYPRSVSVNVGVRVTNATGCSTTTQRALNVSGPDVVATASAPQQVCGDNDSAIEPGEHWRVPVALFNAGGQAVNAGHAIFTKGASAAASTGYTKLTNVTNAAVCPYSFVDISASGTLISFGGALDDAASSPINLGNTNFRLFNSQFGQVRVSTNGYIANISDDGENYTNVCGIGALNQSGARPRLQVLHDDLILDGDASVRYQIFPTCPRAANAGASNQSCTIFQWTSMQRIVEGTGGNQTEGTITFQAIVYEASGEVVYQYRDADPSSGGNATISILGQADGEGLEHSCNLAGAAPAGRSVCFFDNALASPFVTSVAKTKLTTPAVAIANLTSGQTQNSQVNLEVDAAATCGSSAQLRYVGTVDPAAASMRGADILNRTIGEGSNCQVFSGCASTALNNVAPESGFFANFNRFGNGMGHYVIPTAGNPVVFGAWFTGEANRLPTWYAVQDELDYFQVNSKLFRTSGFACPSCQPPTTVTPPLLIVGDAQITYLNSSDYVFTWNLNGTSMGERQSVLYPSANSNPNRTGAFFYPSESGWGVLVDDHLTSGAVESVNINFIYEGLSTPRWTLGASGATGGNSAQSTYLVHCPHCPSLPDFLSTRINVGNQSVFWSGLDAGSFSSSFTFPAPMNGSFNRSNVPLQSLTPTPPQGEAAR